MPVFVEMLFEEEICFLKTGLLKYVLIELINGIDYVYTTEVHITRSNRHLISESTKALVTSTKDSPSDLEVAVDSSSRTKRQAGFFYVPKDDVTSDRKRRSIPTSKQTIKVCFGIQLWLSYTGSAGYLPLHPGYTVADSL